MIDRLLAFIPSPGSNEIVLGPLHLRAYGLMIALGVFAAIEISRRRWMARGGDPDDISAIALWAVPAGLIGARIYHVITDNELYRGHWFDNPFAAGAQSPLMIWNGGLGIPGGIALGVAVGVWVGRRRGMRLSAGIDVVAPAMAVAQAIGRLGNYFNQELFGRPTTLPWGLKIDVAHRPTAYLQYATFQPTFLYEALWNLALAAVLVALDRRRVLRPGRIFALYIGGYAVGRLIVESLRSDPANRILGLRVNTWTSIVTFAAVAAFLLWKGLRRREGDSYEPYIDGHHFGDVDPNRPEVGEPTDEPTDEPIDEPTDEARERPTDDVIDPGDERPSTERRPADESVGEQGS